MSSFRPAWWLPGPHLQTLWPNLLRRIPRVAVRRERLELPDGDFVDLDWTLNDSGPLAIILHGLEGSVRSHYAAGMLQALQRCGWRGVVLHFRGCSGVPNRLARGYHAGDTADLDTLVRVLRAREPDAPLAAIGYSLGGNVLLKWLGEHGDQAPLIGAAAVSVPFDLAAAAQRLTRGISRLYQWVLLRRMRRSMIRKWRSNGQPVSATLDSIRSMREFDDRITAPLHGFAGVADYYARASCGAFLKSIHVPTLILHALDDPFMTPAVVPDSTALSPAIRFELTATGGHVGFVMGDRPWRVRYYPEVRLPAFLDSCLAGARPSCGTT